MLRLNNLGFDINEISKKTDKSYSNVWNVLNRTNKPKIKKDIESIQKAKLTVAYWNKHHYEGQVMTLETKQAFELLGLEVPCKN